MPVFDVPSVACTALHGATWPRRWSWKITATPLHALRCPISPWQPTDTPRQVNIRVPTEAHVLIHFKFEEADIEAIYYTSESLLSALPPNYISAFEVFFFFPALPHLCCWCVDRPPLIASLWP